MSIQIGELKFERADLEKLTKEKLIFLQSDNDGFECEKCEMKYEKNLPKCFWYETHKTICYNSDIEITCPECSCRVCVSGNWACASLIIDDDHIMYCKTCKKIYSTYDDTEHARHATTGKWSLRDITNDIIGNRSALFESLENGTIDKGSYYDE